MTDIASKAARTAVKAMSYSTLVQPTTLSRDNNNTTVMVDEIDLSMNAHTATNTLILLHASISCQTAVVLARLVVPYSNGFHELPAS